MGLLKRSTDIKGDTRVLTIAHIPLQWYLYSLPHSRLLKVACWTAVSCGGGTAFGVPGWCGTQHHHVLIASESGLQGERVFSTNDNKCDSGSIGGNFADHNSSYNNSDGTSTSLWLLRGRGTARKVTWTAPLQSLSKWWQAEYSLTRSCSLAIGCENPAD